MQYNIKFILLIHLLSILLVTIKNCEIENEICSCSENQLSENIQMNCFDNRLNTSIEFSFETLKILANNKKITLNIQNKLISKLIYLSESEVSTFTRSITSLSMENCKISKIAENSFFALKSLNDLILNTNEIETLEKNSFHGPESSLKKLELYSNRIKSITNGVFTRLVLLEYLDLRGNEMSQIDLGSFENLQNLKILYLSSNKLKVIRYDFFRNLKNLELLALPGNEIEMIEINSFNESLNLKTLYLSSNKISKIKRGCFSNLNKLEILWLHRNEIVEIEIGSFEDMFNLKLIYLSSNKIKRISMGHFAPLNNLEILHMYQNELEYFETCNCFNNLVELNLNTNKMSNIILSNFSNLALLNLSSNILVSLSIKNMPKLKVLDLSHNYLDGFMDGIFENLNSKASIFFEFNLIKHLSKNFLFDLKASTISLKSNELSRIDEFSFQNTANLGSLYLDFNRLTKLEKNSLTNMPKLKNLNFCYNQIKRIELIRQALENLLSLESIDLSNNYIEFISETDFSFSTKLISINLNSNYIRKIDQNSLRNFPYLNTFRFAQNNVLNFDIDIFHPNASILNLDLSFNRISAGDLRSVKCIQNIEGIKLNKVSFSQNYLSFAIFLNPNVKYLDFSENNLTKEFSLFENMSNVVWLELRQTNLKSLNSINFQFFKLLTHLDVSFNELASLEWHSFKSLTNLEYLNVNNNQITWIDSRIFNGYVENKMNPLQYLLMENNQIVSLSDIKFTNYLNLKVFTVSNNHLKEMPKFAFDWSGTLTSLTNQFLFNRNYLTSVGKFSKSAYSIEILNFDFNLISIIEFNSFYYLKSLLNLSIAFNRLELIEKNNFYYLSSLKHLNLSRNRIKVIEFESFSNLNKLLTLDLSFNDLLEITQTQTFLGLNYLNELNLWLKSDIKHISLNNNSFFHLISIGTFFLNETTIVENKCLFTNSLQRIVKRNIPKKFKFYKSINLISQKNENEYQSVKCELIFEFLQFNIFLNLKYDHEFEFFYEKCQHVLIDKQNGFNLNYEKCIGVYSSDGESLKKFEESDGISRAMTVLKDYRFYLTICLFLSILGPYYFMICNHLREDVM